MELDAMDAAVRLARTFADPSRIRLAAALLESEQGLDQLATGLNLRHRDVSRHLNQLREAGFIIERSEADEVRYQFDLDELRRLSRVAFADSRPTGPSVEGDEWEQKILHDFVRDGLLSEIPASRKKRNVILKWLASNFEPEERFPERRVNEILKHYHPDCATLRRELVDNGFLTRDHGIYWRVRESTRLTTGAKITTLCEQRDETDA